MKLIILSIMSLTLFVSCAHRGLSCGQHTGTMQGAAEGHKCDGACKSGGGACKSGEACAGGACKH